MKYNKLFLFSLFMITVSILSSCKNGESARDAYTLVYAAGELGTVPDKGCIVVNILSDATIWVDIPESHENVDETLKNNRDYFKYQASSEYLSNNQSVHFFHNTGQVVDGYQIYENKASMKIGLIDSRETLYFHSSEHVSEVILNLVGKVCPR